MMSYPRFLVVTLALGLVPEWQTRTACTEAGMPAAWSPGERTGDPERTLIPPAAAERLHRDRAALPGREFMLPAGHQEEKHNKVSVKSCRWNNTSHLLVQEKDA